MVVITIAAIYAFLATPVSESVNGVQTSSMIVLFRINGSLQEIERRGRGM